jgi:IS30 family transposase
MAQVQLQMRAKKRKFRYFFKQSPWQREANENTNLLLRQYYREKHWPIALFSSAVRPSLAALESTPEKNSGF